jgi:hypothetical protein
VFGGHLTEPLLAVCFAVSVVAWTLAARAFGPRVALATALLLLLYPGYGALFHELSSEPIYAVTFAVWAFGLVRTLRLPTLGSVAVLGAGVAALTLERPGTQILVLLGAVFALLARGSLGQRAARATAFAVAALAPLVAWTVHNGLRYGDYTLARGATAAFFQHSIVVDRDVSASNGPATRQLLSAVRGDMLQRQPYRGYRITLHELLDSGSLRAADSMAFFAYERWGWDGGPDLLGRVGREAVDAHRLHYARGVVRTVWLETSEPYYPAKRAGSPAASGGGSPHPATRPSASVNYASPPDPHDDPLPGGQNGFIARPDGGIRQVWTSRTTYRFEFATPALARGFDHYARRLGELFGNLPRRSGRSGLAVRLNQLERWFPRPILWVLLGGVALAVRRPRRLVALAAPAVVAAFLVVVTALVAPFDVRYLLPLAPAFVVFAAGAVLGEGDLRRIKRTERSQWSEASQHLASAAPPHAASRPRRRR